MSENVWDIVVEPLTPEERRYADRILQAFMVMVTDLVIAQREIEKEKAEA